MPTIAELPDVPVISEVREDRRGKDSAIVIKMVETRYRRGNPREESLKNELVVRYTLEPYRVVSTLRICESGFAEVRIPAHDSRLGYSSEAHALFAKLAGLVNETSFEPLSIETLKQGLWDRSRRAEFAPIFAFRHSRFQNPLGTRMDVAGTQGTDLADDTDLVSGIDAFRRNPVDVYVDRASVALKHEGSNGIMSRDISLVFTGREHEFSVFESVDRDEYEFILAMILKLSQIE